MFNYFYISVSACVSVFVSVRISISPCVHICVAYGFCFVCICDVSYLAMF